MTRDSSRGKKKREINDRRFLPRKRKARNSQQEISLEEKKKRETDDRRFLTRERKREINDQRFLPRKKKMMTKDSS